MSSQDASAACESERSIAKNRGHRGNENKKENRRGKRDKIGAICKQNKSLKASCFSSGTQTGVKSSFRNSLASFLASRLFVLIRSPGLVGINDGAATTHLIPIWVSCRYIT